MNSIYKALLTLHEEGQMGVLCSIIRSRGSTPRHVGSKMLVYPDGSIIGTIGGGEMEKRVIDVALETTRDGQARIETYELTDPGKGDPGVCGGQVEVFVEPIMPQPNLVVVGGGHVGQAVARLAEWLDFKVTISDDRPDFATPQAVPAADEYITGPLSELPEQITITSNSYILLCTRNVNVDVEGLPALLKTPAAYIGIIGSRRRWETTRQILSEQEIPQSEMDRVVSPMGLELNAETPEEIAVSIVAEIIMLRRGGDGSRMTNHEEST